MALNFRCYRMRSWRGRFFLSEAQSRPARIFRTSLSHHDLRTWLFRIFAWHNVFNNVQVLQIPNDNIVMIYVARPAYYRPQKRHGFGERAAGYYEAG